MNNRQEHRYFVYILSNPRHKLYVGMTRDLQRRIHEHKQGLTPGFASRYKINWLVYFEETSDVKVALEREKQIKGWLRSKKIALIESTNPRWIDLARDW